VLASLPAFLESTVMLIVFGPMTTRNVSP
jgi:hypothetical protein